jgi:hypothetical protein
MLFVMLVMTCMIFVPLYAAVRLTMERNDSNIDLVFITTIAPAAIIRGKFGAAVALTALIYSACLPFLTFTYLLRGIDLPSIFLSLAIAFLMNAIVIMLAIFVGSIAGGWVVRMFLAATLAMVGGYVMVFTIIGGLAIVQSGLTYMFTGREVWGVWGTCILLGSMSWGLFYLLAVAGVSPRSSNRMFPFRVFVTVAWLLFGIVLGLWSWIETAREPLVAWVITSVVLLSVGLGFALSERESWTPRVQRFIPRRNPGRLLAWLFFTGSAGGVIWCILLAAISLLVGAFVLPDPPYMEPTEVQIMCGVLLFAWCYSMTGLLLRRLIAPRSPPLVGTCLGLLLFAMGCTLPILVTFVIYGPRWQFDSLPLPLVLPHPFVLGRTGSDQIAVYAFLLTWAIFGLLANITWFHQQWRAFQRYVPKSAPLSAPAVAKIPVIHAR